MFLDCSNNKLNIFDIVNQDLPGSIHEDTVMDGHRQGKKANAYKYPLMFLKLTTISVICVQIIVINCKFLIILLYNNIVNLLRTY